MKEKEENGMEKKTDEEEEGISWWWEILDTLTVHYKMPVTTSDN
jgi:hypothetical protein